MDVGYFGSDQATRMMRQRVQDRWQDAYAPIRHLDPVLVLTSIALAGIGLALIYSATAFRLTQQGFSDQFFVRRQVIALIIGLLVMVVAAAVDYRWTRAYSPLLYVIAILLLLAVLTPLGEEVNGARRWISLGPFNLQPSEVGKVAVIVALSALLHEQKGNPGLATVGWGLLIVGLPMGLVFLEPDLGTSIVFVWLAFILFMVGGVRARYLFGLATVGIAGVVAGLRLDVIEEYQLRRLTAFLDAGNPELALGSAFHTRQSLIAIGSGQIGGKGYLEGTQNTLSYVPENHTDFIFTVVGEEFGFLGAVFVLALLALLMWRGLRISMMAKDLYGTLVAAAIVGLLALQVFVNVGMTLGIMPVTGIPLPFLSYGGTSLIVWFGLIGLLLNIHMRRFS
jgi:rod shape determining protein RodA